MSDIHKKDPDMTPEEIEKWHKSMIAPFEGRVRSALEAAARKPLVQCVVIGVLSDATFYVGASHGTSSSLVFTLEAIKAKLVNGFVVVEDKLGDIELQPLFLETKK